MPRLVLILVLFACAAGSARADWQRVKEGLDQKAVLALIGPPMLANKSRSGRQQSWTYDAGGSISFENGRVRFWQAPRVTASKVVAPAGHRGLKP